MAERISRVWDGLLEHYVFALMILAQAALAQFGVGNAASVGMVGALLCCAGLGLQRGGRVDLWALVPMLGYWAWGTASAWRALGNPAAGYPATHMIFLTVYLLMACMDGAELRLLKRLNALWACCGAGVSLGMFLFKAMTGTAGRLGGLLGNPNALGTFLAVGWFALRACLDEEDAPPDPLTRLLGKLEPLVLVTLSLTLSMGSFLAMAGGIGVLLWKAKGRRVSLGRTVLAKASLCFGAGLLMYVAARQTRMPWLCVALAVWLVFLCLEWELLEAFLERYPLAGWVLAAGGVLVALAAVVIRPSALATFTERLEMMKDGLGYLAREPVFGVGPGQWREWNLHDGGKYFGTWHIHNFLVHTGAELGIPAAVMLLAVLARHFRKTGSPAAAAFVLHNLMDTTFFSLGVTTLTLVSAGEPGKGGRALSGRAIKALFVLMLAHYLYTAGAFILRLL